MIKSVCVYCASSNLLESKYYESAQLLGKLLGEKGVRCINGGGNRGLMQAVSDSVMQHGGSVLGVAPEFMIEEGWVHDGLTELVVVQTMHERKAYMVREADAIVVLPGGVGTFDEFFEIVTWKQLGLFDGKIVLMNIGGYYDLLLDFLEKSAHQNFIRPEHLDLFKVAASPHEVMHRLFDDHNWAEVGRKFAAI